MRRTDDAHLLTNVKIFIFFTKNDGIEQSMRAELVLDDIWMKLMSVLHMLLVFVCFEMID
jgi:hypothetical protein